jgi:hypothetical protein
MISGNSRNTDPAAGGASYACSNAAGEWGPSGRTIAAALVGGKCTAGGELVYGVNYPYCWDGRNLDSPNHISHMSAPVFNEAKWAKECPTSHPVAIPAVSFNVHYRITSDAEVARWKLSSDFMVDPALPRGITGHGDVFFAWDPEIMRTFVEKCVKAKSDCHADLIGDNRTLY